MVKMSYRIACLTIPALVGIAAAIYITIFVYGMYGIQPFEGLDTLRKIITTGSQDATYILAGITALIVIEAAVYCNRKKDKLFIGITVLAAFTAITVQYLFVTTDDYAYLCLLLGSIVGGIVGIEMFNLMNPIPATDQENDK